jgi:uncharacterized protein YodC (DUF2158 family)
MSKLIQQYEVGDVVILKSGGPRMTVSYVVDTTTVDCVWFAHEAAELQCQKFHCDTIQVASDVVQSVASALKENKVPRFDEKLVDFVTSNKVGTSG